MDPPLFQSTLTKTADDNTNRSYVEGLNVQAASAKRLANATASDSTANQTYISSLDVDAAVAKRARTLATDATASEMVTNGQYVQIGRASCRERVCLYV